MAVAAAPAAVSLFSGVGSAASAAAASGSFFGLSAGTYAAISAGASGVLSLMQGMQASRQAQFERQQRILERNAAQIAAVKDSNARTNALLDTIASRNAAYGARNVALGLGTPQALDFRDYSTYNENQRLAALNSATSTADSNLQITAAGTRARNSIYTGLLGAAGAGAEYLTKRAEIGSVPQTSAQASGNVTTGAR